MGYTNLMNFINFQEWTFLTNRNNSMCTFLTCRTFCPGNMTHIGKCIRGVPSKSPPFRGFLQKGRGGIWKSLKFPIKKNVKIFPLRGKEGGWFGKELPWCFFLVKKKSMHSHCLGKVYNMLKSTYSIVPVCSFQKMSIWCRRRRTMKTKRVYWNMFHCQGCL